MIETLRIDSIPWENNERGTFHVKDFDNSREYVCIMEFYEGKGWRMVPETQHEAVWVEYYVESVPWPRVLKAMNLVDGIVVAEREHPLCWTKVYTRKFLNGKFVEYKSYHRVDNKILQN